MQALILFMLFGLFATTVGGLISYSTESTTAFIQATVNAQQQTFEDLATVVNGLFSPTYLDLPGVGTITNPAVYFCSPAHIQTAKLLDCTGNVGGQPAALDQWSNVVTGYMKRFANTTLTSSGAGGLYSVQAPVTAVVLVSAGPDGKIDPQLAAKLGSLNSSSSMSQIMAIAATPQTDDIVVTFSNQQSQQDAIAGYQADLNRIAAAALLNYQGQFTQYQPQLANVYAGQFDSGPININDQLLQKWRTSPPAGTSAPTFNINDLNAFGVTPEINEVQRGLCDPGTPAANCPQFVLNQNGTQSTLNFWLTPQNGLPWTVSTNCGTSPTVNCTQVFIKGS